MSKIRMNTGLASIILVASIFAGWQGMLLAIILLFAFCDVEDTVKNVAISVITFYVGYTIVSVGWDIIVAVVNAIISAVSGFAELFNTYVDPIDYISVTKIVAPVSYLMDIADDVVSIMLTLAQITFVIAILSGKPAKKNALTDKIQEYVNKAINYVTGSINQQQNNQQQNVNTTPMNQ